MATKKYYVLDRTKPITLDNLLEIMATGAFWSDQLLLGVSPESMDCLKEVSVDDVNLILTKFWPPET